MTEKDLDIAIEKCERIMEFDTRTLENPESENGHIFEKVYDLLQFLRQLQFGTDTNVGGNLIDRQAALDAIKKLEKPAPTAQHLSAIFDCEDTIKALPPAQPGCEDAVSRFEVLRLIDYSSHDLNDAVDNRYMQNEIKQLPSVTPKQPGWIPCTPETMPEKTDTYLVQVGINKNGEGMHTEVRTAVWNVIWQKWYVHTTHCFVGDIIKWMPIPWEGGQDGV